ncbi:acyl-CoA dehydrogenase/oxidase [Chytriomyces sp. MP71]|nr:acyl-CoA dehydrogenase/oxidase [Chytriomyces sp. MP71]
MDADPMTAQAMQDISTERSRTSFPIATLAEYFDGGPERHKARKLAHSIIARDPALAYSDKLSSFDMTRAQWRAKTAQQLARVNQIRRDLLATPPGIPPAPEKVLLHNALFVAACELSESLGMRMYVHDMLYVSSIRLFGTPAQIAHFLPEPMDARVHGCFAMTELGHSSSLQDLETTATYSRAAREWVLLSPRVTSTKWWIGSAGTTATHAVLVSQTVVKGVSHGLAWFVVPLRDIETGRLLPGVTCGDIGAKAGRHGLDNGWIQLTNVRVPLQNMLMKWMQVDEAGNVSPAPHPAIMYATLIPERISALTGIRLMVGQSVTIACRYGVTRRQGPGNPQIIDFQAQTVNMLPLVAGIYVYQNTCNKMEARWSLMQQAATENPDEYLKELPDIHCISAGLKAVGTWWGSYALELCRRACGGHAYSAYNAIAGHIGDWGVMTTGGGDNFALINQISRYVFTCVKSVLASPDSDVSLCFGSAAFINNARAILSSGFKLASSKAGDFSKLDIFVDLLSFLVVRKASDLIAEFAKAKKKNQDVDVWNLYQVDLTRIGTLFTYRYVFKLFVDELESLKTTPQNARILPILTKCGLLFAGDVVRRECLDSVLEEGCLDRDQVHGLRTWVYGLAKELRQDVVGLTDAFGFPDFILKAPIGRYDGDIYRTYFNIVKNAPDCFQTPYFVDEVKPLLERSRL